MGFFNHCNRHQLCLYRNGMHERIILMLMATLAYGASFFSVRSCNFLTIHYRRIEGPKYHFETLGAGLYRWLKPTNDEIWDVGVCVPYNDAAEDAVINQTILFLRLLGVGTVTMGGCFILWLLYFIFRPPTTQIQVRSSRGMCIVMTVAMSTLFFIRMSDLCSNTGLDTQCKLGSGGVVALASLILWMVAFVFACLWMSPMTAAVTPSVQKPTRRRSRHNSSLSRRHRRQSSRSSSSTRRGRQSSQRMARSNGEVNTASDDTIPDLEQAMHIDNSGLSNGNASWDDNSQQTIESEDDDDDDDDNGVVFERNECTARSNRIYRKAAAVSHDTIPDLDQAMRIDITSSNNGSQDEDNSNDVFEENECVPKKKVPRKKIDEQHIGNNVDRKDALAGTSVTDNGIFTAKSTKATIIKLEQAPLQEMVDMERNISLHFSDDENSIIHSPSEDSIPCIQATQGTKSMSDCSRCESF